MGFGSNWLRWMEGTIFSSDMSVLINGSITKDFKVEKGLRQGDPLSPFLFVLVTEVLTDLMNKAISIGMVVAAAGNHTVSGWQWDNALLLADSNSIRATGQWLDLLKFIAHVVPRNGVKDSFTWRIDKDEVFTVKTCFSWFYAKLTGPPLNEHVVKAASFLWNLNPPSNFLFFGWRIIHDRIVTKDNLLKRGILNANDSFCVFCLTIEETLLHLLGGCRVVLDV
ncbi:uncharacterized protein LOC131631194 [Vicia villosa]|uniref:uncharacterized protein LOC131631194 n=1 Tax=Vicia villosa TaxID=3911 RepID=UPI00273AEC06|nr:uncharacterized protein LOC131631194 [Vicia villosa]